MHIPDGFLGPKTCLACYAAVAPFWVAAWRALRRRLEVSFEVPYVALAAAFAFVLMLFNVPIPGGTSGHAVGTAIVTIALGVGPAILAVSFALAIQALLFQDGGLTAFGANVFNMAVVQALVAAALWRMLAPRTLGAAGSGRAFCAAFGAGYGAAVASALTTALQLGVQPALERGADGLPLYFPIGLQVTIPAMVISHLFIGVLEGAVTGFAISYLTRSPRLLPGCGGLLEGSPSLPASGPAPDTTAPSFLRRKSFWAAAAVAVLAVPLGIWLPAAVEAAEPWGEWSPDETAAQAGLSQVPAGMARLADFWRAPLPDYSFGAPAGPLAESLQYIASAILGVVVIGLLSWGVSRRPRRPARSAP